MNPYRREMRKLIENSFCVVNIAVSPVALAELVYYS